MSLASRIRSASETNPGVECCTANDVKLRCPKCQAFAAAGERPLRTNSRQEDTDCSAPDPYAAAVAKLRAAEATPESTFAKEYAAMRTQALADSRAAGAALVLAEPARLTAAELATFAPPCPYAAGLKTLQAKEAR